MTPSSQSSNSNHQSHIMSHSILGFTFGSFSPHQSTNPPQSSSYINPSQPVFPSAFLAKNVSSTPLASQSQLSFQAFLPRVFANNAWYMDSGVDHHLTFDRSNLANAMPYPFTKRVMLGNTKTILITHFGNTIITARTLSLRLNNLLHVPH